MEGQLFPTLYVKKALEIKEERCVTTTKVNGSDPPPFVKIEEIMNKERGILRSQETVLFFTFHIFYQSFSIF